ncbi:MAG: aspartyl/asparaginyl beta-hydroxylase domain-containing protein, partial [Sphingomicrobium sp.]
HMQPGEAWVFDSFKIHEVRNDGGEKRVHLVLDTVGSDRIRQLIGDANAGAAIPDRPWRASSSGQPRLRFERVNHSTVMSPWEMRCHADYLLEHTVGQSDKRVRDVIDRLIFVWQAAWTEYGDSEAGWPSYRQLVQEGRHELHKAGATEVKLDNEAPLYRGLDALILSRALMAPGHQAANLAVDPRAA